MEETLLEELEKEYIKIDKKWLFIHYLFCLGLVVLALVLECFIGWILYVTGEIHSSISLYLIKFLLLPSLFNGVIVTIASFILPSSKITQNTKIYIISIFLVTHCFIIFTVHSAFNALFIIFIVPILLTSIYGKYKLSSMTAVIATVSFVVSELFIRWDLDKISVFGNGIRYANFIISVIVIIFFYIVSMVIIYFERKKNSAGYQKEIERYKLRERVLVDDLTGINNRIAFRNCVSDMEGDSSDSTYIFVLIDLDNFKMINDNLGHVSGDQCLISFAGILKRNSENAIPFRYGGDEFSLLFKNVSLEKVIKSCKQIQSDFEVANSGLPVGIVCTASFGVAPYSKELTPSQLIVHSDKALYESKIKKNSITVYSDIH